MIFKARKICCEMLTDRNYEIPENEENISFENFKVRHQNNDLDLYVEHSEDSNNKIYVRFFFGKKRINESDFKKEKDIINKRIKLENEKINYIFITQDKSSANVSNTVGSGAYSNIELFELKILQFNATKHKLQPKFEMVKKSEEPNILEFWNCPSKSRFPTMLHSDPIARYYGLKPGDLIKITRTSSQTGHQIVYKQIK